MKTRRNKFFRWQPEKNLLLCVLALSALLLLLILYNISCTGSKQAKSCSMRWRSVKDAGTQIAYGERPVLEAQALEPHSQRCSVSSEKRSAISASEPLISQEPAKPWIILKRNLQKFVYLSTVTDLASYSRRVYIDVGARSYGSSVGSWFKKQYPKRGQAFEVFAIEADKSYQSSYATHPDVHFLPYAAWLRNETLIFGTKRDERGGMGRIQIVRGLPSLGEVNNFAIVQGFDLADWFRKTLSAHDYVVVKMDVEGAEFDLLPRLIDTGAICLIDELFLECHYNRWQKCCPERSSKFKNTYQDCLSLFQGLRHHGIFVHQWW